MKFLMALLLAIAFTTATAKEYVLINPNAPGSASELTARKLSEIYQKKTGNVLVVESIGGGNQIPAVVKFKNLNRPAMILATTSILAFNPKMIKDLPYTDQDFDPVSAVAMSPLLWVTGPGTAYRNMKDLAGSLSSDSKTFIGYAAPVENANIRLFATHVKRPDSVEPIRYKGPVELTTAILSNEIPVAVISFTPTVVDLVKAGRLRILGSSIKESLNLGDNLTVPSVQRQLGVMQITGGTLLALSPKIDAAESAKLKQDLIDVLNSDEFQENLRSRWQETGRKIGPDSYYQWINEVRNTIEHIPDLNK
jgi:tripartite-type tricarboxylate transporter receptor subunit TctC